MQEQHDHSFIRVQIAKDVIAQLDDKRAIASPGAYLKFIDNIFMPEDRRTELQDVIKDKRCEVCAVGALFVSAIDQYDNYNVENCKNTYGGLIIGVYGFSMFSYLKKYFSAIQLSMIESAFEGVSTSTAISNDIKYDEYGEPSSESKALMAKIDMAVDSYEASIFPAEGRMRAIMNNIINNNGMFIPTEKAIEYLPGTDF
jgi:hypothetical protein